MVVAQLVERHRHWGSGRASRCFAHVANVQLASRASRSFAFAMLIIPATSAQVPTPFGRIRRRLPNVNIVVALFGDPKEVDGQELSSNTEFVERSLRATCSSKFVAIASSTSDKQGTAEIVGGCHGP